MRILLDECVPTPLAKLLRPDQCFTARQCGWDAIHDGQLLKLARERFDLFITADQNMAYQQNLAEAGMSVLVLTTNNFRRLEAAIDLIREAIRMSESLTLQTLTIP